MITAHASQLTIALGLVLAASVAAQPDAPPPPGPGAATGLQVCFPLDGLRCQQDLAGRLMSGGCWLAGLPGYPRYNGTHVHAGIDLRASLGDAIYALVDGTVDPASDVPHGGYGPGWTQGGAMIVRSILPDGSPYLIVYGHTQNHRVKGGDMVQAGQMLGEVGPWLDTEGGPHLHLTVRLGDLPRFGWGTPTLAGQPVREGAECAGSEEDVLKLGYRNPLVLLTQHAILLPMASGQ
jgi:murein DD-endopeptidase MepM/ murein hydrolase activator NlpD